jgi:(2Fe-2S) ferredoxin
VFSANDSEHIPSYRVHVCFGPNCTPRGSRALLPLLEEAIRKEGLSGVVEVMATTCRNRCDFGPSVNVYPGPTFYAHVNGEAVEEIVREHFRGGKVVERWRYREKAVNRPG